MIPIVTATTGGTQSESRPRFQTRRPSQAATATISRASSLLTMPSKGLIKPSSSVQLLPKAQTAPVRASRVIKWHEATRSAIQRAPLLLCLSDLNAAGGLPAGLGIKTSPRPKPQWLSCRFLQERSPSHTPKPSTASTSSTLITLVTGSSHTSTLV